jgi:hypothetical protein
MHNTADLQKLFESNRGWRRAEFTTRIELILLAIGALFS